MNQLLRGEWKFKWLGRFSACDPL